MRRQWVRVVFMMGWICSASICAAAVDPIGTVTEVRGEANVLRDGRPLAVENGFQVAARDVLKTGADGAMGVVFKDETTLSIGPKSELAIDDYVFSPHQGRFAFVVSVVRGTAAYVSGLIAKLCPESARFVTPSASIGIRGTKMVIQVE
jgi:hypothetical protein